MESKISQFFRNPIEHRNLIGIAIDHTTGEIKRKIGDFGYLNKEIYPNRDKTLSDFKKFLDLSDNELKRIVQLNFEDVLSKMKEEENNGYPSSIRRSYELGDLTGTVIVGTFRFMPDIGDVNKYDFAFYTGLRPLHGVGFDPAFNIESKLSNGDRGIIKIKEKSIYASSIYRFFPGEGGLLPFKNERFPDDYEIRINPRSVGIPLLPEDAKRYQKLLDSKKVNLRYALRTVGEIVNNSIQWVPPQDVDDREWEFDRLPHKPGEPYTIINKPQKGFCLDAGESIRSVLINLGFEDCLRIDYKHAPGPLGLGHDNTLVFDIENGHSIFINSKEGEYKHPILLDYEQFISRFPSRKR